MARKNILADLMAGTPTAPVAPAPPRAQRGAIGAVSRSIADLKARSVIEIDAALIHAGGVHDRLESLTEEDAALARSIAEYGQQVPVLVRPHPEQDGHFQIVYGRRRVLALRDLGLPVRALVRDLDDQALIMAQGQENTARRDLSYIEKVNFARQMEVAGYARKYICDALTVDKTQISRMMSIAERIPVDLIEFIGAAPTVGRDRWQALADLLELSGKGPELIKTMISIAPDVALSDARFQAAWTYLSSLKSRRAKIEKAKAAAPRGLFAPDGMPLGEARSDRKYFTMKLHLENSDGFEDWLMENLGTLFDGYQANRPKS